MWISLDHTRKIDGVSLCGKRGVSQSPKKDSVCVGGSGSGVRICFSDAPPMACSPHLTPLPFPEPPYPHSQLNSTCRSTQSHSHMQLLRISQL